MPWIHCDNVTTSVTTNEEDYSLCKICNRSIDNYSRSTKDTWISGGLKAQDSSVKFIDGYPQVFWYKLLYLEV